MTPHRSNVARDPVALFTLGPGEPPDSLSRYLSSLSFHLNGFGHQHDNTGAECPPRVIGDIELILYRGGTGWITIADQRFSCAAGDLVLIPPYVPHEIRTDPADAHDNYWVHVDVTPSYERDRFAGLLLPPDGGYRVRLAADNDVAVLMELVARQMTDRPPGYAAAVEGLLRALLVAVVMTTGRYGRGAMSVIPGDRPFPADGTEALDRVIRYAMEHLADDFGADDLASAAGCSRSRLFELFRERLGRTPMAFVRWLRLRQVELLLKTSDLTVTEISSRVGIVSPFHLSRLFKAQYGVSPSDYRRRVLRLP